MYVASVETDFRSAPSATTRGSDGSSDFFAELLRRHREVKEPASRPRADAERSTSRPAREHDAAPSRHAARAESEAGKPVDSKADARPEPERAAVALPDKSQPVHHPKAQPADDPADAPAAVASATADTPELVAAVPAVPATVPATDSDISVSSATTNGTVPTTGGTPAQVDPAPARPATPAPAQSAMPAQPGFAAPATELAPDDAITDPLSRTTNVTVTVVETEGKPTQVPSPAQGLGKLGSGAEIALSAQAAGETPRPATPAQNRSQQAANNGAGGSKAADQPAAVAGTAPRPSPAAATPLNAATQSGMDLFGDLPPGLDPAPGAGTGSADQLASGTPGSFADLALRAAGRPVAGTVPAAAAQSPAADQVAVQIQRAVRDGNSRIIVQLNPAELGQVEVQLEFGQDGRVSAAVLADRADTLDMLQRDARLLERSLQEAGLKADSGSLSFDLRDGGRSGQWSQDAAGGNRLPDRVAARPEPTAAGETTQARPATGVPNDGGVDIRV